jgi:hypothetical protein
MIRRPEYDHYRPAHPAASGVYLSPDAAPGGKAASSRAQAQALGSDTGLGVGQGFWFPPAQGPEHRVPSSDKRPWGEEPFVEPRKEVSFSPPSWDARGDGTPTPAPADAPSPPASPAPERPATADASPHRLFLRRAQRRVDQVHPVPRPLHRPGVRGRAGRRRRGMRPPPEASPPPLLRARRQPGSQGVPLDLPARDVEIRVALDRE